MFFSPTVLKSLVGKEGKNQLIKAKRKNDKLWYMLLRNKQTIVGTDLSKSKIPVSVSCLGISYLYLVP